LQQTYTAKSGVRNW